MASFASNRLFKIVTASATAAAVTAYGLSQLGSASDCHTGKRAYKIHPPMNDYPDLRKHNNCLANHLTPFLYSELRDKVRVTFNAREEMWDGAQDLSMMI